MPKQYLERLDQMAAFLIEPAREFVTAVHMDTRTALLIIYTWRSVQVQQSLFQQGRTFRNGIWVVSNADAVVTDAPPGTSGHNVITEDGVPASVAFDAVPVSPTGVALWGTTRQQWQRIWDIAWKFGFDPLGDALGSYYPRDLCHFEEPAWQYKLAGLKLIRPTSVTQQV